MPPLPQLLHDPTHRTLWRALLLVLLAVVSVAALAPGTEAPSLGIGDKVDHLLAFVSLTVAATMSWPATRGHAALAGAGLLAYGAFIEVAQTQVPGRYGDVVDVAVDAAGIVAGLALAMGLRSRWPPSPA
ncbi:MAG: VanZ family protein [Rubrivivax sp.]|nr:VanZ family protein [Rubrivivax sp.]